MGLSLRSLGGESVGGVGLEDGVGLGGKVGEGGDGRREDVAQEGVLVADERQRLCEFGLCVGVVLEGVGRGGTHSRSSIFLGCRSGGHLLEGAEEGTHGR